MKRVVLPFVLIIALFPALANCKERHKARVQNPPAAAQTTDSHAEEKYFPLVTGTTWVYHDAENRYLRREVKNIQPLNVRVRADAPTQPLAFVVVQADTAEQLAILKKKPKNAANIKTETQYYLKTSRGILNSAELGESAALFWKQAFLVLSKDPAPETVWETWIHGAHTRFSVEKTDNYASTAGKFSDCLKVDYQQGMEGTSDGFIIYCAGVGEVKLVEGTFERELIQFTPPKKTAAVAPVVDATMTEFIWALLSRGEEVAPPVEILDTAPEENEKPKPKFFFVVFIALAVFLTFGGIFFFLFQKIRLDRIPRDTEELKREIELCKIEQAKGNLKQSQKLLEGLLKDFPDYPDLYYQLGTIQEETKNEETAIVHYRKAVDINPQYIEAHLRLAQLYQNKKDFHQALENVTAVLNMHPEYADVHNIAGEILRQLGDEKKARTHFQQALELNPHYTEARRNLQGRVN